MGYDKPHIQYVGGCVRKWVCNVDGYGLTGFGNSPFEAYDEHCRLVDIERYHPYYSW